MSIFEYILTPFLFFIEKVYLLSYNLTGSYGLSIILLSFAVSAILLPVFIIIEKTKKRDDTARLRMKPLLDEIKRCYKGQERYYYIKTLNRQHGYNPIRALIPTLSLLLQIPFFIAAYQFLKDFEPLAGAGFLFIRDLSQPDGLLGSINVLPIIMTLVNLLTAYFYTRNGSSAERKQMVVVAGIFLVLLFNLPAGLVLYWTMNNVFSFFRLFITNPEVFKKVTSTKKGKTLILTDYKSRLIPLIPKLSKTFWVVLVILVLSQLSWAFKHNFDDIALRLFLSIATSALVVLVIGVLVLMHRINLPGKGLSLKEMVEHLVPAFRPMLFAVIAIIVFSQVNWAFKYSFDDFLARLVMSVVAGVFVTVFLATMVLYYKNYIKINTGNFQFNIFRLHAGYRFLFWALILILIYTQISWALKYSFDDIVLRLSAVAMVSYLTVVLAASFILHFKTIRDKVVALQVPAWVYYSLIFMTTYFYLASTYYFAGLNKELAILGVVFMAGGQILAFTILYKNYKNFKKTWWPICLVLLSLLILSQLVVLLSIAVNGELTIPLINFNISSFFDGLLIIIPVGIIFLLVAAPFISVELHKKHLYSPMLNWSVYLFSSLYLTGFIFLWNPIEVYSSFPANFEFTAFEVLSNNFKYFILILLALVGIKLILPKGIKVFWQILILTLVFISFINNTLAPINVGTLQENVFLNQDKLAKPLSAYLVESMIILLIFFIVKWIIEKNFLRHLRYVIIILNLVLILQSTTIAAKTGSFFNKDEISLDATSTISFSKEEKNIVFVILDMFHGWYMNKIIEDEPELKSVFDGFTWYPNTLAVSSITGSTLGPILGGFDYTVDKLNQSENSTLEEDITAIAADFNSKIRSAGFRFIGNNILYSLADSITYDTFLPRWHPSWDRWNSRLNIGIKKEVGFTLLWNNALFYSAPLFVKPAVYNRGQWLQGDIQTNENTSKTMPYNFLRLLPYISHTESTEPNFIYVHSMASHHPWDIIDEDGILQPDVTPYENNKWSIKTFAQWIKWMKENDVYDNTKIVVISDHGPHWMHFKGEVDMDIPIISESNQRIKNDAYMSLFALMLIKDFNQKGELDADWRFMSNADVNAIIFDDNDPTKVEHPSTRTLPSSIVLWERRLWELNQLRILQQFEVTDNAFDLSKWERTK